MRVAPVIELNPAEEQRLRRLERSNTARVREARRAAIVLRAAQGLSNREIAERLGIGRIQVGAGGRVMRMGAGRHSPGSAPRRASENGG